MEDPSVKTLNTETQEKNGLLKGSFNIFLTGLKDRFLPRLTDAMITSWKFSQLDVDRDRLLRDDELFSSQMKKMFGHIRRGRKCSKKLAVSCDFDHNGGLSLEEWRKCLGRRTSPKGIN